jgi:hypothetical protein
LAKSKMEVVSSVLFGKNLIPALTSISGTTSFAQVSGRLETTQHIPIMVGDTKVGRRKIEDVYFKNYAVGVAEMFAQTNRPLEHLPSVMNAVQSRIPSGSIDLSSYFSRGRGIGAGELGRAGLLGSPSTIGRLGELSCVGLLGGPSTAGGAESFPNGYYEIRGVKYPL